MKIRTIQSRFLLLFGILTALFAGGLVAHQYQEQIAYAALRDGAQQQHAMLAHSVLELRGTGLSTFAGEWSRWDEMAQFVADASGKPLTARMTEWARINVDGSLGTTDVDVVWIYDPAGHLVYSTCKDGVTALGDLPGQIGLSGPTFVKSAGAGDLRHFFVASSVGPIEMRADRILHSADENRAGKSLGYLYVGRIWGKDRVAEMGKLLHSEVSLTEIPSGKSVPAATGGDDNDIVVTEVFPNAAGVPAWVMRIVKRPAWLAQQGDSSLMESVVAGLFVISFLVVLAGCLRHWIGYPVQSIMNALRTGNVEHLHAEGVETTTEFKELADLIQNSHRQHRELEEQKRVLEEQKREVGEAHEELQRQSAYFRSILDATPNLILIETAEGQITFANRSTAEKYGVPVEEVVGRNIAEFISDPPTLERIRSVGQDVLAVPGEIVYLEERIPMRNGTVRWNETAKRAIASLNGTGYEILVVITDITERKAAEVQLFRVMNSARCQLWSADVWEEERVTGLELAWKFEFLDEQAAQRFLPLPIEPGQAYYEAAYWRRHPEDRERTDNLSYEKIRRGENYSQEFRVQQADGEWRWMREDIYVEEREACRWRVVGVTVDVTEKHEAEQVRTAAVRQQQAFLQDVLVSVTEGHLYLCASEAELPSPLSSLDSSEAGNPISLTSATLSDVRRRVRQLARKAGFPDDRMMGLMSAASECAMNAVTHGGERAEANVLLSADGSLLQVWVRDYGSGIDVSELPKATLMKGYSGEDAVGGFGHGFFLMLQSVDRIYLLTGEQGTTVVIEQRRTISPDEFGF